MRRKTNEKNFIVISSRTHQRATYRKRNILCTKKNRVGLRGGFGIGGFERYYRMQLAVNRKVYILLVAIIGISEMILRLFQENGELFHLFTIFVSFRNILRYF